MESSIRPLEGSTHLNPPASRAGPIVICDDMDTNNPFTSLAHAVLKETKERDVRFRETGPVSTSIVDRLESHKEHNGGYTGSTTNQYEDECHRLRASLSEVQNTIMKQKAETEEMSTTIAEMEQHIRNLNATVNNQKSNLKIRDAELEAKARLTLFGFPVSK
ncbi:hypothetical protein ARMGADRAFT_1090623 [Armillaria gallica]|uniref:Uncharacterized protein n=1 Tax=Armillaria gallica TaxID=47427 RepID=A0A2H3CG52_ARMGA|nr:hypothetical protein ARMGADRAFT_1090623 [Armillaria gallica]